MEIAEIKDRLSMGEVLSHYGLSPNRNGMLNCPFHPDRTPSMQVYPKTDTVYCFSSNCPTHGKSLDVIDFILHREKCSKAAAIRKAKALTGASTPSKDREAEELSRSAVLTKVFSYFRNALPNSKGAQEYIESRNLDPAKVEIGYNSGQFYQGGRKGKDEALIQSCVKVGLLTSSGETYKPFAKGCISFALRNRVNQIVSLYFRSLSDQKVERSEIPTHVGKQRHFYLKNRQGLYPHYPKADTKKLILTESIIDAASLLQVEEISKTYSILALYGTNGLTEEHTGAIKELKDLKEIIFFLNGDEPGRKAVAKHAETLKTLLPQITLSQVSVPEGEDVNSLVQSHEPSIFIHLLEKRSPLSSRPSVRDVPFSSEMAEPSETRKESINPNNQASDNLETSNPLKLRYRTDTAVYVIQGGIRSEADSMKVTLVVEHLQTQQKSRSKLDLYEDKQVERIAREAGEKLNLRADLVQRDLEALTDRLDVYRDLRAGGNPETEARYSLTVPERRQAEELLKTKDLFARFNELIGKAGVVGEEQTRLFLFVIASSYRMPDTLHALVQGSSGSGKTHLIVKVGELMPPEDVKFLTRVTESSFYNYGEYELRHKLFCMEDLDGLKEEAFLAFRELQSREQLSSSTSEKNEQGKIHSHEKLVRGPIASLSATTKGEIYEDNMSRCFLVSVDESPDQTQRIIEYQNRRASGGVDKGQEKQTTHLLRNCVRLLHPYEVINPYAGQITLPEEAHKIRRLNDLYQSFVRQVTRLNQYKRNKDGQGRLITEKEDLEQASEIMFDSIMLKVDELDGSLRQFYERLKTYVQGKGKEYRNYAFGRKEIRDALRVSKTQQHRFFSELLELEYISQQGNNSYRGYRYKVLVWDDMAALRMRIKRYMQGQLNQLELFNK